jgi:hypothetical protein
MPGMIRGKKVRSSLLRIFFFNFDFRQKNTFEIDKIFQYIKFEGSRANRSSHNFDKTLELTIWQHCQ